MLVALVFYAAVSEPSALPWVGTGFGVLGAIVAMLYVFRFQMKYVNPLESDRAMVKEELQACKEDGEHKTWQLDYLALVLRAHGTPVPQKFWSANWREESIKPDFEDFE